MTEEAPLPPGWATARLSECCDVKLGKMLSAEARDGGTHRLPYLRNQNVRWGWIDFSDLKVMGFENDELEKFNLKPGDLLMCEGGEPGRCAVFRGWDEEVLFQKALHRIRPLHSGISTDFLQLALQYQATAGIGMPRYSETTIKHLTLEKLKEVPTRIPPAPEQRRIVAKTEELFSELDAGAEALARAHARLERYRASVLKAAVGGRLSEAWRRENPPEETGQKLLERILVERRIRWEGEQLAKHEAKGKKLPKGWRERYKGPVEPETTDLPDLPDGWAWGSIDQLTWGIGYGTSLKCSYQGAGTPVVRIPNIKNRHLELEDLKSLVGDEGLSPNLLLGPGDFLVIRTNGSRTLIGRGGLVTDALDRPFGFASYLIRLRLCGTAHLWRWIAWVWESSIVRNVLTSRAASSAGQYNLSIGKLNDVPIPIPPIAEMKVVLDRLVERESRADAGSEELRGVRCRAARLRQSILRRAFEGRLVPQHQTDEAASILLDRVRAEREGRATESTPESTLDL